MDIDKESLAISQISRHQYGKAEIDELQNVAQNTIGIPQKEE